VDLPRICPLTGAYLPLSGAYWGARASQERRPMSGTEMALVDITLQGSLSHPYWQRGAVHDTMKAAMSLMSTITLRGKEYRRVGSTAMLDAGDFSE
jgi:hypothetical protein